MFDGIEGKLFLAFIAIIACLIVAIPFIYISEKEDIALRASQDILDRNIGKAVQKQISTNLNITFEQALNDLNLLDQ